jgi:hypothetical protein
MSLFSKKESQNMNISEHETPVIDLESYEKIKKNRRFTKKPSKYRGLDPAQVAKAKLFSE